jgi:hypothetical protein
MRADIAMAEAGHSDHSIRAAYNDPLDEAHRQGAEQVAARSHRRSGCTRVCDGTEPGSGELQPELQPLGQLRWSLVRM